MKRNIDHISREDLETMSVKELQALAKENYIKLYTVKKDKIIDFILETLYRREHHGDAFRY